MSTAAQPQTRCFRIVRFYNPCLNRSPRTITPRFGKPVTIQPAPKLERISPQSEIPILNR